MTPRALKVDQAWNDLHSSFEYYDNYLDMLNKKLKLGLTVKHMSELTPAQIAALPAEGQKYVKPIYTEYHSVQRAERAAWPHRWRIASPSPLWRGAAR